MKFVKLTSDSYPIKYYSRTYKVTNTLKIKGIGLINQDEESIKNFLQKFDVSFMAYLIYEQDVIYVEFYKKKDCAYVFNFLNNNPLDQSHTQKMDIKAEYVNVKYNPKSDPSTTYSKDYSRLVIVTPPSYINDNDRSSCNEWSDRSSGSDREEDVSFEADAVSKDMEDEIIRKYEEEQWQKYTKNDEINIGHYFCRSTPNKIYKSYCIQDENLFFTSEFLERIKILFNGRYPNQISILKCHTNKSVEYVIESRYIFQDEIGFLVLHNDLPMSFLDIRNEVKTNLVVAKNTFIKIKGRRRYELLFGIPKKKTVALDSEILHRKNSYLIIFRFIDESNLQNMLSQKHRNEKAKDQPQEKSCIPVNVNHYTSDNLERKYVLDVYNQIAKHFCYTRYKSWNNVENIINEEREGNIIMDVGCGNGKNVQVSSKYFFIGLDFSLYLLKLAQKKRNTDIILANCVNIPMRSNLADLCISIAVIHHIGTHEKRRQAVSEMVRCTKVGGRVLIYVWAYEQQENIVGNRKFDSQDIFVPWYLQQQHTVEFNQGVKEDEGNISPLPKKDLLKLQRYYHVFKKEELYNLCLSISGVHVENFFFDNNNWVILLRKVG
ncbi:hypothetical protein, conserved [Plasmodium gonderi]|uniref:Methyltransferase type 11 domain-containing protein n=1 Tax=Plasmodium gonderi TaxID=77519 RepID=A0A1Y1JCL9_PLAGO|nr:hypothetical protein, conserved [Plasmodium gonderi]GAW79980.1 hypothetical protein, conserved [Plasmodium gonderi]